MGITYIISAVLLVFLLAMLGGIYEYRKWDNETGKYIYDKDDRVKIPVWAYLIIGISFFLPVWNIICYIASMIGTAIMVDDEGDYIHISWLSWLGKEV